MPAKYALADAALRFTIALLFLVAATTGVTEKTAIQAEMHAYAMPRMLVWPADVYGWPRLTRAARALTLRRRLRLAGGKPCRR